MLKFSAKVGRDIAATTYNIGVVDVSSNIYRKAKIGVLFGFNHLKEEAIKNITVQDDAPKLVAYDIEDRPSKNVKAKKDKGCMGGCTIS